MVLMVVLVKQMEGIEHMLELSLSYDHIMFILLPFANLVHRVLLPFALDLGHYSKSQFYYMAAPYHDYDDDLELIDEVHPKILLTQLKPFAQMQMKSYEEKLFLGNLIFFMLVYPFFLLL